ncbi:hypothetical protein Xsto_02083 [Xenorhabdus stockiae]|uniref:Uncharacterized protein n=1 Tax=Xenorhabdus stockiae TaxID=351614 RepID=A0A2D0KPY1_9GAMM|nr:hypothetical protein Xsto_02083 [Xenorhabdus stockiae]PHM70561.1 hypothetical protein Xekj_01808 [Xenorhabdus sp. KJ12.1]
MVKNYHMMRQINPKYIAGIGAQTPATWLSAMLQGK